MSNEQYWSPDHSLHKTQSDLHTHAYTCYNIHKFLYVYDTNRSLNQHSLTVTSLDCYVGTTIIQLFHYSQFFSLKIIILS